MSKTIERHGFTVVELTEEVKVETLVPSANHAALRCGFAGYPSNPRWNAAKFCAWKTGRLLKEALGRGEMVVRSTDSMLVPASQGEDSSEKAPVSERPKRPAGRYQLVIGGFRIG